eukprot:531138-Pyramimonas_sp.AAC.1
MKGPGAIAAGAGQSYEDKPTPLIWSCLDRLFARSNQIFTCRTVRVFFRTRLSHCRLGGRAEARLWDRV